jgi:hypothetical protein
MRSILNDSNNFQGINPVDPKPPSSTKRTTGSFKQHKVENQRLYNMTNPPLLTELENFLQTNLSELKLTDSTATTNETADWLSMKKLKIYRDAFGRFIEEFNIYKPFLLSVKHEYENALDYISNEARNTLPLKTELIARERECNQKIIQKELECNEQIRLLTQERDSMKLLLQTKEKELKYCLAQIDVIKMTASKSEKESSDIKGSCVTLTSALTRIEDEKKKLTIKDNARQSEILTLKITLQKANNDLER